jgi:hypothetical protein
MKQGSVELSTSASGSMAQPICHAVPTEMMPALRACMSQSLDQAILDNPLCVHRC